MFALASLGSTIILLTYFLAVPIRAKLFAQQPLSQSDVVRILRASTTKATILKTRPGIQQAIPGVPDTFDNTSPWMRSETRSTSKQLPSFRKGWGVGWSVRVVSPGDTKKVLFVAFFASVLPDQVQQRTAYLDEAFEVPLPAGEYLVCVDLLRVPFTTGVDAFMDPQAFYDLMLSGGRKPVTLGQ